MERGLTCAYCQMTSLFHLLFFTYDAHQRRRLLLCQCLISFLQDFSSGFDGYVNHRWKDLRNLDHRYSNSKKGLPHLTVCDKTLFMAAICIWWCEQAMSFEFFQAVFDVKDDFSLLLLCSMLSLWHQVNCCKTESSVVAGFAYQVRNYLHLLYQTLASAEVRF